MVARLAPQADKVASRGGCAARDAARRLRSDVIGAIAKIPQRYREELLGAANDLAERLASCPRRRRASSRGATGQTSTDGRSVQKIERGTTPQQQARNISAWLRHYSR